MTRLLPALLLISSSVALAHGDEEELAWVVVRGDRGASMHGDMSDLKRARKYFGEHGPEYLWFRRQGKEYVVRDGKVIDEIDEATRPQEELGNEGRQQEKLAHDVQRKVEEVIEASLKNGSAKEMN